MPNKLLRAAVTNALPALRAPELTWKDLRTVVNAVAAERGEWGGAPIPMDHVRLIMEPRYPFKGVHGFTFKAREQQDQEKVDYTVLNTWVCRRRGVRVWVCREANGQSRFCVTSNGSGARLELTLNTLGVAAGHAWDEHVEDRALTKLRALLTPHAYRCYMLAGMFLETSRRSGVKYLFRKLRPTIAMGKEPDSDQMRTLAVLCLHPLGFYEQTWAGVMCPTDDVVAHLMLMRADEHGFWKKANHHDQSAAEAGI